MIPVNQNATNHPRVTLLRNHTFTLTPLTLSIELAKWSKLMEIMHSVGWNLTQRELKYSIFTNRGIIVHPGKCVALGECYPKNPAKDFDRFWRGNFWWWDNINLLKTYPGKGRKTSFSGSCITNRQKWVNSTKIQSVTAEKNYWNPLWNKMVSETNLKLN